MNTNTIVNAIGDIDEELFDRSEQACRNPRKTGGKVLTLNTKRALRIAIAAAAVIILTLGIVMTTGAKGDVLPPARWDKHGYSSDISASEPYAIGRAYNDADAVCLVTIGNWRGDNGTGTFYDAHVEKLYKGDIGEDIVIYQMGTQDFVFKYFPLFTHGNRILVWVVKEDIPDDLGINDDYYCILGDNIALLFSAFAKDGKEYLCDVTSEFSFNTVESEPELHFTNFAEDEKLLKELYADLYDRDPVYAELIESHKDLFPGGWDEYNEHYYGDSPLSKQYVYSLEELEEFFDSH